MRGVTALSTAAALKIVPDGPAFVQTKDRTFRRFPARVSVRCDTGFQRNQRLLG